MNAEQLAPESPWRRGLVTLVAAEAVAVAAWLIPASIHIVKWPEGGPVRLALLPPTWQLLAWGVGALVLTLVALALGGSVWKGRRNGDAGKAGRGWRRANVAPLLMLWLWIVPYLPWLPDRLPLLLVLAGPLRWVIATIAVIVMVLDTVDVRAIFAGVRVGRRTVFVVSLAVYLVLGLNSARRVGLGGDEPHYLIITESLLKDHDLKIENNHQQRDYRSFYGGELRPDFFERGKNGAIYSIHAPGLPVLILPAYALGGRVGVVVFLALIAALTALAIFDLATGIAGQTAAVIAWIATCFTVPFLPHAWMIFPDLPGTLIVAWAALWLWQSIDRSALLWASRAAVLSALPWLHTKFVVFLAIFAVAFAWRLRTRPRLLGALVTPVAISGLLWLYSFYAIYGSFDPEAPYGAYTAIYVLTENIPHGLLGIFFDAKFGLLFYSPIYLAAIAGAWLMLRRADTRLVGTVLLLVVGAFVVTTARLYMYWGGNSAPARFLVPILPCLGAMVALAIAHARSAASRALIGLSFGISLAVAIFGVIQPERFLLFSDPHRGGARIVEAIQGPSPLAGVTPGFSNPDWAAQIPQLGLWLLAAVLAVAAMAATSRVRRYASAWRLSAVGALAFLIVGAIAAATPAADVKDETARRGDLDVLWRFDGNRFRTLDYETLARVTPERLKQLTTIVIEPAAPQNPEAPLSVGPFGLPPGRFAVRASFKNDGPHEGELIVSTPPETVFGRAAAPLSNPTTVTVDMPVAVRRLMIRVPEPRVAAAMSRLELIPLSVVPAGERENVVVRAIESIPDRDGAYLIYADEHVYPEGVVFWSRGTAETTVWVAAGGRSRLTLTLFTGPMSGEVRLSVGGKASTIAMAAGEVKVVSFELPPGQRIVPVTVQSDVMFRPGEIDKTVTDMRGLGCQVRVGLE